MKNIAILLAVLLLSAGISFADEKSIGVSSTVTPSIVGPGNNGYIELIIENTGTLSIDKLRIYVDSPITMDSTYLNLGRLESQKTTTAIFKFGISSSTKPDFYKVKFRIEYCYDTDCRERIQHIIINVRELSALEILSVSPNSLDLGKNETLVFELKNNGGDISNLVFEWKETNNMILPLGSDNRKFVSYIASGQKYKININALANPEASIGIYPLSVKITYDDPTGSRQSINSTIGIKIVGDFDFVSVLESQNVLAAGKTNSVEIKIVNRGDQEAKFLTVTLSSDSFYIDPDYTYIGNIKPDDYSSEKLWLTTKNIAKGIYPVNAQLYYKDTYGNTYIENQQIDIYVSSISEYAASQPQPSYDWVLIIVAAVVGYVLYRKFWKKRK